MKVLGLPVSWIHSPQHGLRGLTSHMCNLTAGRL